MMTIPADRARSPILAALFGVVTLTAPGSAGEAVAQKTDSPRTVQIATNSIGMKMALVPAGRFRMGSPRSEAERDVHEFLHDVTITKPFYIGVYEVTQASGPK